MNYNFQSIWWFNFIINMDSMIHMYGEKGSIMWMKNKPADLDLHCFLLVVLNFENCAY